MESTLVKSDSLPMNESVTLNKQGTDDHSTYDILESTTEMLLEKLQQKMESVRGKRDKIRTMIEQDYDPTADILKNKSLYLTPGQRKSSDTEIAQLRFLGTPGRDDIKFLTAKYTLLSAAADKLGLTIVQRRNSLGEEDKLFITTKVQLEELKQSLATLGDQIAVREGNIESLKISLKEVDTKLETVSNALSRSLASKPTLGKGKK
jgi:chromosome segregation ATPase